MARLSLEIGGKIIGISSSERVFLGRDSSATVTIPHELVSRRHLEIYCADGHWVARDHGSLNGTFVQGGQEPAGTLIPLQPGTTLMLGDPVTGVVVRVLGTEAGPTPSSTVAPMTDLSLSANGWVVPVAVATGPGDVSLPGFTTSGGAITIGRALDNAIVVHDPMVSAHHARVSPRGGGSYLVEDLDSTNGTFVGGVRIGRQVVPPGSIISLGKVFLQARAEGLVRIAQEGPPVPGSSAAPALTVSQVTFSVSTTRAERGAGPRKVLLDRVSFTVPHRSLVAVIGPSGAGKSTMLKTMIGALKPDQGQVCFNGLDMAVFAASVADRVGMVPQDDLVHSELTARQAIEYAARLRFPDDSTADERDQAVQWALRELGLVEHADTRIARLSGGQRKRVSTAMELLTKPDLLFLDEPTSGLDPNLDREVMELLRGLAHGTAQTPNGRTVVVITHSTENLDKADFVLLLAPGGKVAYFGPPDRLQPFFASRIAGKPSYASIYALIARAPDEAQAAFKASDLAPAPAPIVSQQVPQLEGARARRRRLLPQTLTLLGRQARLMVADRSLILFTLALPVVVGLLTLAVRAADGFNPATTTKAVGNPRILMVVLVFGAVLMGMVPSVRQLIGERAIFTREAGVGVRPSAYLASKVVLLGAVSAIQSALMVTVALALNAHPDLGVVGPLGLELFAMSLATAWACSALGLLLSGAVTTSEQVMPLMVLVLMFQLVMCGGVLNVTGPGINQASLLSPSRWGFAVGASSLDFNRTITCNAQVLAKAKEDEEVNKKAREATDEANQKAADDAIRNGISVPTAEQPEVRHTVVDCASVEDQDRLWAATGIRWLGNMLALAFWFLGYSAGAYATVRRLVRR